MGSPGFNGRALLERGLMWAEGLRPFFVAALCAPVLVARHAEALHAKPDDPSAGRAFRGLVGRGVLQLLEVVLVGPVPHVHLRLADLLPAFRAVFPVPGVFLVMVKAAEGVAAVVAVAARPGV